MKVREIAPSQQLVEAAEVAARVRSAAAQFGPFAPEVMQFCGRLSRLIFQDKEARAYPELQSLAFWMRPAELNTLAEAVRRLETAHTRLVPRGVVFHVPPANVDTMFVYSWIVSVLMGNRNLIRLSSSMTPQVDLLCRLVNQAMAEAGESFQDQTILVQYGHEREITELFSCAADVRVIWGGDQTVNTIRSTPLPPHATELTFPDRFSMSAIRAPRYLALEENEAGALAEKFYNDTFWFDQMACSSPRLLLWCGNAAESAQASRLFFNRLQMCMERKGYAPEASVRMNRFTFACRAILDRPITGYSDFQGNLPVLTLGSLQEFERDHCGGGLMLEFRSDGLDALAATVDRRDQTLTQFGFDETELDAFVRKLNGRGIDRIVPIGQALQFQRFWDGYDLFQSLSRSVYIHG
ncbi:MAG TPA: acyl-CoA reductase [Bryobacteraceae bacterium]|nr:acyl-CoA reductase [Bryobacteraceae bacterium]